MWELFINLLGVTWAVIIGVRMVLGLPVPTIFKRKRYSRDYLPDDERIAIGWCLLLGAFILYNFGAVGWVVIVVVALVWAL